MSKENDAEGIVAYNSSSRLRRIFIDRTPWSMMYCYGYLATHSTMISSKDNF